MKQALCVRKEQRLGEPREDGPVQAQVELILQEMIMISLGIDDNDVFLTN